MSRQVDLSKPLSDEDKAYLRSRGREADIALAEGGEASSLTAGPSFDSTTAPADLLEKMPHTGDVNTLGRTVEDGDGDEPAGEDSIGQYDNLTKPQLEDELERRGLSKSGNKRELVARLEEHDAEGESDDDDDEDDDNS